MTKKEFLKRVIAKKNDCDHNMYSEDQRDAYCLDILCKGSCPYYEVCKQDKEFAGAVAYNKFIERIISREEKLKAIEKL